MGQDAVFRRVAVFTVALGTLVLIYGVALQIYYATENSQDVTPLLAIFIGGYALREVWAFFRGGITSVDHMLHEPRPENTWWRSAGLLGDFALFFIACAMLYRLE